MPQTFLLRKAPVPAAISRLPSTDEAAWRALHAIADRLRPELARRLRDILVQAQRGLSQATLESLLVSLGDTAIAAQVADAWDLVVRAQIAAQVQPVLQEIVQAAALRARASFTASLERLRIPTDQITTRLTGDLMGPRSALWAEQDSASLVTQVSQTTREALRTAVRDAMAHGKAIGTLTRAIRGIIEQVPLVTPMQTPAQQAQHVRALTGLTPRQVGQVERFREGLIQRGMTGDKLVSRVERKAAQLLRQRAELIARTESITAAAAGQQQFWEAAEREGLLDRGRARRHWVLTPDERLCSLCRAIPGMNPDGVGLHEPFQTPIGPIMHPAAHPACVPGDTLVQASDIRAATKRPYDGPMVLLHTASGRQLACTPNHPIATIHGWCPSGLLQAGDYVLCDDRREGIFPDHGVNDDHGPSCMADIAETVLQARGVLAMPMEIAAEDFHGDGKYSQIAVVGANGVLGNRRDPGSAQPFIDAAFVGRHHSPSHDGLCYPQPFLQRFFPSHHGGMGRSRLFGALLGGHLRPFEAFGFMATARHNPLFSQPSCDRVPIDAEMVCQPFDRIPGMIQAHHVSDGDETSAGWNDRGAVPDHGDARLVQPSIDGGDGDAVVPRYLRHRFSGQVACDQVIQVLIKPFIGHVYNLQTATELYVAEGIITHNCRCAVVLTFGRRRTTGTAPVASLLAAD